MSGDWMRVGVTAASGRAAVFDDIPVTEPTRRRADGFTLRTEIGDTVAVTITPDDAGDAPAVVCYDLFTAMRNLHSVILPDSGRWFMNGLHPISAWRFQRVLDSAIDDVKTPLYIFTGPDRHTAVALGHIGEPYETRCEIVEPVSNRALNVHVRQIGVRFQRGNAGAPIPAHVLAADGSLTEHVVHYTPGGTSGPGRPEAWLTTFQRFTALQRARYGLADRVSDGAMRPVWCTWADWSSDDLTDELILDNAALGAEAGIGSYIIDDGWFGPGLDSSYATDLTIGDWEPDPAKIKDLAGLVRRVRDLGGSTLIWCAPHAVGPAARCFPDREPLLLRDGDDALVMNPTQFYSLCFQCPEARRAMVDLCVRLLTKWDFDGAKYDLFNWVPPIVCGSTHHGHDTTSPLHGLYLTLEAIDVATRAIKPDYIVELKQNYGTPFFSRLGSLMRAGDAPYAPDTNFQRTLHVQGYTALALNDYQTFTEHDGVQDVAVAVVRMLAAGVPAYSVDLERLGAERRAVLRHYNLWYTANLPLVRRQREAVDPDNRALAVTGEDEDVVFRLGVTGPIRLRSVPTTILNGAYDGELVLRVGFADSDSDSGSGSGSDAGSDAGSDSDSELGPGSGPLDVEVVDPAGECVRREQLSDVGAGRVFAVACPAGGLVRLTPAGPAAGGGR